MVGIRVQGFRLSITADKMGIQALIACRSPCFNAGAPARFKTQGSGFRGHL